jgi:hypothetical protein
MCMYLGVPPYIPQQGLLSVPLILHRWYWRSILAIRYDPETDGGMESLLDASSWPLVLTLRHRD